MGRWGWVARLALALLSVMVDPWLVVCFLARASLVRLLEELPPLLLLWRILCAALLVGRCRLGAVLRLVTGLVKAAAPLLGSPLLSC